MEECQELKGVADVSQSRHHSFKILQALNHSLDIFKPEVRTSSSHVSVDRTGYFSKNVWNVSGHICGDITK